MGPVPPAGRGASANTVSDYHDVVIDEAQDLTPPHCDVSPWLSTRKVCTHRGTPVHLQPRLCVVRVPPKGARTLILKRIRDPANLEAAVQLLRDHGGGDADARSTQCAGAQPVLMACRDPAQRAASPSSQGFRRNLRRWEAAQCCAHQKEGAEMPNTSDLGVPAAGRSEVTLDTLCQGHDNPYCEGSGISHRCSGASQRRSALPSGRHQPRG